MRSKGVPINEIAERYDGGGHKLACGVKLKNKAEIKSLIKELSEL
ncbi:MAG: hypothetical protein DRP42_05295 [Tenericutes bacterium]|nr:MAG: hypothetical protein DRP42_05295 [Mycoplasmatota bacterium]